MSGVYESGTVHAPGTVDRNMSKIVGMGSALVALNILLMLVVAASPVGALTVLVFGNFFLTIAFFAVTIGGGFWIARKGIDAESMAIAGVGVAVTQFGYAVVGSAILQFGPQALWIPAIGISALITAVLTAVVTVVVFKTDHSFERWQMYSGGCFIGGIALGAIAYFVAPTLLFVAGILFFVGFVVDLTYEIWAVKVNRYESDLRNAIGIYIAVMGVFIHVLQWVLRILSILSR